MKTPDDIPKTLVRGKKGLAQYLQIGETMAAELLMNETIKSVKIGRARLVPIAAIEEYLARLRTEQHSVNMKAAPALSEAPRGSDTDCTGEIPRTRRKTSLHDSDSAQLLALKAKRRELRSDAFPAKFSSWCGLCFRAIRWFRLIAAAPAGSNARRRWCHFDCVVRWHVAPDTFPKWMP